jgi:hypothetical protein
MMMVREIVLVKYIVQNLTYDNCQSKTIVTIPEQATLLTLVPSLTSNLLRNLPLIFK